MKKFEDDLNKLINTTKEMGDLSLSLLKRSIKSFEEKDVPLAEEVIKDFEHEVFLDELIEEDSIRMLTLYQPTAMDIRTISTIMKSITYMERIGKNSKNIARVVKILSTMDAEEVLPEIKQMSNVALEMTEIAIKGLKEDTIEGFNRLSELDNKMDSLRDSAMMSGTSRIHQNPDDTDVYMCYISMSRYLERIGDHTCKIAEKVTYMVTGKHIEIDS